jgi:hypothetical protein
MKRMPEYRAQTAGDTLRLIDAGTEPWLAFGQFLDDWRRTDREKRLELVNSPPGPASGVNNRWAALIAAAVDWLCAQDGLQVPAWTASREYSLSEPWFLYPGWRLRAWQLFETPVAFRVRNIFGGDRILDRV